MVAGRLAGDGETQLKVSLRYQCVTLLGGICNLSAEIHQGGQIDALEESGTFRG